MILKKSALGKKEIRDFIGDETGMRRDIINRERYERSKIKKFLPINIDKKMMDWILKQSGLFRRMITEENTEVERNIFFGDMLRRFSASYKLLRSILHDKIFKWENNMPPPLVIKRLEALWFYDFDCFEEIRKNTIMWLMGENKGKARWFLSIDMKNRDLKNILTQDWCCKYLNELDFTEYKFIYFDKNEMTVTFNYEYCKHRELRIGDILCHDHPLCMEYNLSNRELLGTPIFFGSTDICTFFSRDLSSPVDCDNCLFYLIALTALMNGNIMMFEYATSKDLKDNNCRRCYKRKKYTSNNKISDYIGLFHIILCNNNNEELLRIMLERYDNDDFFNSEKIIAVGKIDYGVYSLILHLYIVKITEKNLSLFKRSYLSYRKRGYSIMIPILENFFSILREKRKDIKLIELRKMDDIVKVALDEIHKS